MRTSRDLRLLFGLALGEAALTVGMTVFVFGSGMSRFDTGEPAPLGVRIASNLAGALACPVLPLVTKLPRRFSRRGSQANICSSCSTV